MNHYKCDRCGSIVEGEAHTDVDNEAETVTLCDDCYDAACDAEVDPDSNPEGLHHDDWGVPAATLFCIECGSTLDEQGLCVACQPADGDDYPVEGIALPTMTASEVGQAFRAKVAGVTPVTESLLPTQTIYFDPDDYDADGFGWNVVDNGSIAARFPTLADATHFCEANGYPYEVARRATPEEIATINDNLKGWEDAAPTDYPLKSLWVAAVTALSELAIATVRLDQAWHSPVTHAVRDVEQALVDAHDAWLAAATKDGRAS